MVRARLAAPELSLLALLAGWSVCVLVHLAFHLHGGSLSGADGLFPGDQLQYLAWARDSGKHILAGDLFEIPAGHRVFVHPMWMLSGLLWRAGASLVLTSLLWKPVAVGALLLGVRAYAVRMLAAGPWRRAAVVLIAVFYVSPIAIFYGPAGDLTGEVFTAGQLWGYLPIVIAIALMPVYLLALERTLMERYHRQRPLLVACGAGLLLAWLHPWQGETMAIVTAALIVWRRGRSAVCLFAPLAATVLPLAGYLALSHLDPAWGQANAGGQIPHGSVVAPLAVLGPLGGQIPHSSVVALLAVLGPLAALSLLGVRRPGDDLQEQAMLLWPVTALLQYYVLAPPSSASHSLEGIAIPLAVMAVRGVASLSQRRPQDWARIAAVASVALVLTVPGAIHVARGTLRLIGNGKEGQIVSPSEGAALRYVADAPGEGGVLAPPRLGTLVPAFTGKPTWVGNPLWTPAYSERAQIADALAAGLLPVARARQQVRQSDARYILMGCGASSLSEALAPLISSRHDFGCASVYTLR